MKEAGRFAHLLAAVLTLLACAPLDRSPGGVRAGDPDAADLARRARVIHDRVLVLDAHADIEIPGKPSPYVGADGLSKVAPAKLRAGGVDAVVMAAAVGPGPRNQAGYAAAAATAEEKIAAVRALVAEPANDVVLARSADEVVKAHESGKAALILGLQNARILGTDVSAIDDFYAAGVRVFALTHMGHNDFADSSRPLYDGATRTHEPEAEHGGLSPLGIAAIQRINAVGGVVDVTQLSRQATLQVLEVSKAPVIASHSNVRRLSDVSRNLSDEEIDRIGELGGVIHVAPFLSRLPLRLLRRAARRANPVRAQGRGRRGGLLLPVRALLGDRGSRGPTGVRRRDQRDPGTGKRRRHAGPPGLHRRTDRRRPRGHRDRLQPRQRREGIQRRE
jgi:microsomal dipeptidase-like Zn-dependent dipeptidase